MSTAHFAALAVLAGGLIALFGHAAACAQLRRERPDEWAARLVPDLCIRVALSMATATVFLWIWGLA